MFSVDVLNGYARPQPLTRFELSCSTDLLAKFEANMINVLKISSNDIYCCLYLILLVETVVLILFAVIYVALLLAKLLSLLSLL